MRAGETPSLIIVHYQLLSWRHPRQKVGAMVERGMGQIPDERLTDGKWCGSTFHSAAVRSFDLRARDSAVKAYPARIARNPREGGVSMKDAYRRSRDSGGSGRIVNGLSSCQRPRPAKRPYGVTDASQACRPPTSRSATGRTLRSYCSGFRAVHAGTSTRPRRMCSTVRCGSAEGRDNGCGA